MVVVGQKLGKLEVVGITKKGGIRCVCECGDKKTFPKRFSKRLLSGEIESCGCDLTRLGYRFRLYPNVEQSHDLDIQFGHSRFVYNHFLTVNYHRQSRWLVDNAPRRCDLTGTRANHLFPDLQPLYHFG